VFKLLLLKSTDSFLGPWINYKQDKTGNPVIPFAVILWSPWIPERKDRKYHYDKELKLSVRKNGDLHNRPSFQTGTIIHNDEAVPSNRSNHLMGTRLLPSSDDSSNTFSGTLLITPALRQWSIKTHQWLGLFDYAYLLSLVLT
jgi:hypothetical protein